MGKLLGGSTKTTTKSEPWAPQGDQLKTAFSSAGDLYNSKKDTPYYTGDTYAGMDGLTAQGLSGVGNYANGAGAAAAGQVGSASSNLLGANQNYLQSIGAFGNMASQDPTQSNIASAGQYADNPYLSGQIDAASRDVTRQLSEQDLPSIDRAATGSGNINSTRAGVASGIAMRGAQDRIGDISSQMRGDAYNQGLGLAENSRQANMGAMGSAAGLYGQAVGQGLSGSQLGQQMTYDNYGQLVNGGQINQADAQGKLDQSFNQWQGNDTRQQDLLNNYYGVIGANNWGGTQTQKTSGGPGILGGILGVASTGLGLASGFGALGSASKLGSIPKIGGSSLGALSRG